MTARIVSKTKQQAYSFKESAEAPASSSMTLASLPKRGPHSPSTASAEDHVRVFHVRRRMHRLPAEVPLHDRMQRPEGRAASRAGPERLRKGSHGPDRASPADN